jgi:hypothetical protein
MLSQNGPKPLNCFITKTYYFTTHVWLSPSVLTDSNRQAQNREPTGQELNTDNEKLISSL